MYIQSLDRIKTQPCSQSAKTALRTYQAHSLNESYESIVSIGQIKKKRVPTFVSARKCEEKQLPEKNIFTSKGIMEVPLITANARKSDNKLKLKFQKRDKCLSFCDKVVSKPIGLTRSKTPKIMIKSVFNFNIGQRKYLNTIDHQDPPTKTKTGRNTHFNRHYPTTKHPQTPSHSHQKNDFIGWETEPFLDHLQTL